MKNILVIGTLDTKGEEFSYLKAQIERLGMRATVMDLGILGAPAFAGDIPREAVMTRAGVSLARLRDGNARGAAIEAAILGGQRIAIELFEKGEIDGVIAMGGGSGTSMGTKIMRLLPLGFPKCLVTTLSNLTQFLGNSDICVLRSMVDLVGLNSLTRTIIQEAAAAITGMTENRPDAQALKSCVAVSCLGVTTPCVMKLREGLLKRGRDVVVLHFYTGIADDLAREGRLEAMLDITPCELTKGLIYPETGGMPRRLEAVREAGVPIITAPGALDMLLNATPLEKVPQALAGRQYIAHSPNMTLLQTTAQERARMGAYIAGDLCRAKGPAVIVIPEGGFSMWDAPGKAFYDPDGIRAFTQSAEAEAGGRLRLRRSPGNINDDRFAQDVLRVFDEIMDEKMEGNV
ncbi:MAG: Tm-1-like ATP-binding domain-containing protein [Christensenellaceae bacterium]|nr:Tm-1-like ATP-binding domain-containing protein [Christensenellaceae bacterium]